MARIVAAAAASHSPGITAFVDMVDPEIVERYHGAMHRVADHFAQAEVDVLVVITNEHFVNFYLNNVPSLCIGTASAFTGPVEPFLRIPHTEIPGDRPFAKDLVRDALDSGFDVAFSEELKFDHGTMVPLHFVNPDMRIPIVPVMVNNLYEPLPSPARLYDFGRFLGRAIADHPSDRRVGLLATGGLSHKVGTPDAGELDPDFDRAFLAELVAGNGSKLAATHSATLAQVGNGTHEVRNWICVMGAIGDVPGTVEAYEPVPEWATGCGVATWTL